MKSALAIMEILNLISEFRCTVIGILKKLYNPIRQHPRLWPLETDTPICQFANLSVPEIG